MDGLIKKPDSSNLSNISKLIDGNLKEKNTIIEKEKDNKDIKKIISDK